MTFLPQDTLPHPQLRSYLPHFPFLSLNHSCIWSLWLSQYVGFPWVRMWIKFGFLVNLSHVDLIMRPAERNLKGRGKFIPPPQYNVIDLFTYFKKNLSRISVEKRLFHDVTHRLDPSQNRDCFLKSPGMLVAETGCPSGKYARHPLFPYVGQVMHQYT